jgi:cell division protein FtsW
MEAVGQQRHFNYTVGRRIPVVVLLLLLAFLNGLGLIVLLSIGRAEGAGMGATFFKQSLWTVMGLTAFAAGAFLNPEKWRRWSWFFGAFSVVGLCLVLVPGIGSEINGARRWIDLGPMNMQVSDVAKIGYLFCLAHCFAMLQREGVGLLRAGGVAFALIGLFFALILLQPDYGTAFLYALVGVLLLYLSGISLSLLLPAGLAGGLLFVFAILQDPVRLARILSFMDVEGNRSGGSYQLWQGIIGFGVGGVSGTGLGNGRQQFAFLPEAHTDFIFPIIGEELGFVFTLSVALAFALFFWITWSQLRKAPTLFQFLLIAGALFFISLQALINMGVSTGILPTKGMSLPFISYGGSNLATCWLLAGLIAGAVWRWNDPPKITPREVR